ncbi:hypothetical protein R0137_10965 [Congregibacter brevis]|uniref:Uncharacterized protein n=1 Tax=Congregibacter brevis TaxID=3081201 RepID=A0ABZ0I9P1_9GAMM|nr:hypothetical protein R0137_10965 [Congregibacter sp. IMCC45268]
MSGVAMDPMKELSRLINPYTGHTLQIPVIEGTTWSPKQGMHVPRGYVAYARPERHSHLYRVIMRRNMEILRGSP